MGGIIKRCTTTGKSCPEKALCRKLRLTDREVRLFRRYISNKMHLAVANLVSWARLSFGKTIPEAFMGRYIQKCGYRFYKSKHKPFRTTANKPRPVAWAKSYLSWIFSQWERVLWTDESIFQVSYGNVGLKVIRMKDEANYPYCYNRVVLHPSSVMVWGCIAANGVGNLHFCRDK